jgi:hypothetical protein
VPQVFMPSHVAARERAARATAEAELALQQQQQQQQQQEQQYEDGSSYDRCAAVVLLGLVTRSCQLVEVLLISMRRFIPTCLTRFAYDTAL